MIMKFLICLFTFVFAHDLFLIQNSDALCLDGSKGVIYISINSHIIFHKVLDKIQIIIYFIFKVERNILFILYRWISGLTES